PPEDPVRLPGTAGRLCRSRPGTDQELFEAVRRIGAERIVSKRRGSLYRGGESREWLKIKCSATGEFGIIGLANSAMASSMPSTSPRRATESYAPQDRSGSSLVRGFGVCSMRAAPGSRRTELYSSGWVDRLH